MTQEATEHRSQLLAVLREGVSVVQMVLFKELRKNYSEKYSDKDIIHRSMLIGAVINRLFGLLNPEERFLEFAEKNKGSIEQEMLALSGDIPQLRAPLTDALRVQVLCDSQEGEDSGNILLQAESLGILIKDRDIPLPSAFMTNIRTLGEEHGVTIAPVKITPEQDEMIQ